jgi:hypothetical protein
MGFMYNNMTNEFWAINTIFTEWNPIKVPHDVAKDEYLNYIALIIENRNNILNIVDVIENILISQIGLDYQPSILEHKKDLVYYAFKMYLALNKDNISK